MECPRTAELWICFAFRQADSGIERFRVAVKRGVYSGTGCGAWALVCIVIFFCARQRVKKARGRELLAIPYDNCLLSTGNCSECISRADLATVEAFQLPAPDFTTTHNRTVAIVYGHRQFEAMTRSDRVRACYQHAALKHVMRQYMTNKSLRERFGLGDDKSAIVSQVISAAIEEGVVKADATVGDSRRLARYLPFWA